MKSVTVWTIALLMSLASSASTMAADETLDSNQDLSVQDYVIISRDVIVQDGDTLSGIAKRELGRTSFVPLLAEHNNLALTATLQPGDIIRIPIKVPPRGEFAEVVFVKGIVTATRVLAIGTQGQMVSTNTPVGVIDSMNINDPNNSTEVITLTRNARVFSGDEIRTSANGYVSIAFSSGSVINLQPDTVATLEHLACLMSDDSCLVEINTLQGNVTSDVEARDLQPVQFRINTPYASATVRGTMFDVNASDELLVGVTEGGVDVAAQGETVPLPTGFGLSVEEGEPPGEPIELIPPPVFKRIPARIAEGDTVEWWPFSDAVSYKVILSTDEEAIETIQDFRIPATPSTLAVQEVLTSPLEPGDYFLTLRAVDFKGLLGFSSNTRITLASIDPDLEAVGTSVVRQGSEFLVSVVDGPDDALGYEIQISSDESFSDPLSVDVNEQGTAVFRIDEDQVFTRARILVDPYTVSEFGDIGSN